MPQQPLQVLLGAPGATTPRRLLVEVGSQCPGTRTGTGFQGLGARQEGPPRGPAGSCAAPALRNPVTVQLELADEPGCSQGHTCLYKSQKQAACGLACPVLQGSRPG